MPLPATSPDAALISVLVADVGLSLVAGTSAFCGPMPDGGAHATPAVGDRCVSAMITDGGMNEPFLDGNSGELCRSTVQVFIRGDPDRYSEGLTLARAIRNAVNFAALTGYVGCDARESEPTWLGFDELRRPLWTVNAEILWHK